MRFSLPLSLSLFNSHSGQVDPAELGVILRSLGYSRLKLPSAMLLAEKLGANVDEHGHLELSESRFVKAMITGEIANILGTMSVEKTTSFRARGKSFSDSGNVPMGLQGQKSVVQKKDAKVHINRSMKFMDHHSLVKWTLRSSIVSDNLSGATQLLLLAHTPVSRKVFQYFHCNDMAGTELLRADYDIDCQSDEYFRFRYFVGGVLFSFTFLLPATISFYLYWHRKDLYSTKVHQRLGWLYDPFVRGAEFWQVHDLLMKMVLTGMLIYIPTTSRAGVAILICVVCCCNLNYFQPHKNKLMFWLSQVSFITTTFKYTTALLLALSTAADTVIVGYLLIFLDIFFITSSVLCLGLSLCIMRIRIKQQRAKDSEATEWIEKRTKELSNTSTVSSTKVSPVESIPSNAEIRNFSFAPSSSTADKIQANFEANERQLHERHERRRNRSMIHTQLRVEARLKVRKAKTLNKVAMFAQLTPEQLEIVLKRLSFTKYVRGDVICCQGDMANSFYIIVTGECHVTLRGESDEVEDRWVKTLNTLDYFGESSLIGVDQTRNATVTVSSERMQVLHLDRQTFDELVDSGVIGQDAIEHAKAVAEKRAQEVREVSVKVEDDNETSS